MIMNMNEKGRQTKLLAAIAVLAMVVCVLAAVMPSSTVNGANQDPATNMPDAVNGTITLTKDLALDGRYYVESDVKAIDLGGFTLTAASGDSFAIEVPAGQTVSIDNGTIKADIAGINVKGTAILGSKLTVNAGSAKAVQILGGDVTVNGSTLTSTGDDTTVYIANNNDDNTSSSISGKLTFNSGTVSGGAYAISGNNMRSAGAIIDINGGTFSVKDDSTMSAIFIPMESTVSINNAEINGGIYVKMGNITIDNSEITETRSYNETSVPSGDGGQTNGSAIIIGAQKYGSADGQFINSADLSVTIGSGCTISSTSGNDLDVFNCKANTDDSQKTSINVTADLVKARIINDVAGKQDRNISIEVADISNLTLTGDADVTVNGDVTLGAASTVNKKLTVTENGSITTDNTNTLTVNNAAIMAVYGNVTGSVINNGTLALAPGIDVEIAESSANKTPVSTTTIENALGLNQNLDSDYEVKTKAFLEKDLTVAAGVTLTVSGTFDLNGKDLYVYGTIIIKNGGIVTDGVGDGSILLAKSGVIENSGNLGNKAEVEIGLIDTVSGSRDVYGDGTVTVKDVYGIEFSIDREVDSTNNTVSYTLAVSGTVTGKGSTIGSVTVTGDVIATGEFAIGNKATFSVASGALMVESGAVFEIDSRGVMTSGTVALDGGASVILSGSATGTFQASTGKYLTNGEYSGDKTYTTQVTVTNVVGLTIEATTTSAYDADLKDTVTEDRLLISGTIDQGTINSKTDDDTPDVTYDAAKFEIKSTGTPVEPTGVEAADKSDFLASMNYKGVYVEESLYIDETVTSFTMSGIAFTVIGTVNYDDNEKFETAVIGADLTGAMYSVENVDDKGVKGYTYYIRSFDAAFADIANAYETTIAVYGDVEVTGELTLAEDQSIEGGSFEIAETGKFTVANGAYMSVSAMDVQGILVVMADGTFECAPENFLYSAMSENNAGDRTYSGFMVALNGASEGDVIEVSRETNVENSFIIPAGVTVRVTETGSLNAGKDMTVNGTLDNQGVVTVAGKTIVGSTGTVDVTEDLTTTFTGTVDVTGTLTSDTLLSGATVNAFWYQNDDGYYVYTNLSNAVTAVSAMDVMRNITQVGTVNDSSATEIEDIVLTITGTASLGNITMTDGRIVVTGTLTATITGPTGAEGATVDSTVELTKAEDVTIINASVPNAENVQVWSLTLTTDATDSSLTGDFEVAAGTVTIGTMTVDGETMTVASGATLLVPGGVTLTVGNDENKAALIVEGTITVNGTVSVSVNGITDIDGTMDVVKTESADSALVTIAADSDVSDETNKAGILNIAGTLNVVENETLGDGAVTVNGILSVAGTVTGPVDLVNGYVRAYADASVDTDNLDLDAAGTVNEYVATVFNVNGAPYMTVYIHTGAGVTYNTVLGDEDFDVPGFETVVKDADDKTVYDIQKAQYWFSDVDMKKGLTGTSIGSDENAYIKLNASTVTITVSVGEGISLYIDDVRQVSNVAVLSVGTHTVTATVNPGFNGTVTVTFNGQTISGSFEITADMASAAYDGPLAISATGDITQDSTTVVTGGSSDDSLGLTDYLLIILVVLIVIMAIMVAMRLMRS